MKLLGLSITLLLSVSFFSCQEEPEQLTIYYSVNEPMGKIALKIHDILESNLNVQVKTEIGKGSIDDMEHILNGDGHLALVENHVAHMDGIRSLMPLYPQILHVFYKGEPQENLSDILKSGNVFLGYEGDGSYYFGLQILEYYDIELSSLTLTHDPFSADVLFGFTEIISNANLKGLSSYKLFSFDEEENFGKGSVADGIALKLPKVRPFMIPKSTYGIMTDQSVVTIASDVVLVASADLSDEMAYDVSKTIFRNLQEFNEISPLISQDLREDFSRADLNFSLHEGARIYLDRDEPSFIERYAELFGLIISLLVASASGLFSLMSWLKQRKKDRIDVFYQHIMNVKNSIPQISDRKQVLKYINSIKIEERKAFQMLIDEKLSANESFRIYMELSKETVEELKVKYRTLS